MRAKDEVGYVYAIWETFRRKHAPDRLMASNREGMLIRRWIDQQIPLPVVLRAIDEFQGTARRLEAFEVPVERAYQYWRDAMGAI